MAKVSKKLVAARLKVDKNQFYSLPDALKLAQETSYTKFDGAIDLAFNLNLDVRQADQQLRGAIALPNGNGKVTKVLVATDDLAQQEASRKAGAEKVVGMFELTEILNSNNFDFDVIITDPKMMPTLGKFGKVLGPKGLMPNPKTGTVTVQVAKAVEEVKKGKANYRTDKNGIIHTSIGRVSMKLEHLTQNAEVIIDTIKRLKPTTAKGVYMKNLTVSATMGPAIKILLDK